MRITWTETVVARNAEVPSYIIDAVRSFMDRGLKISAIKLLRAYVRDHIYSEYGLSEARAAVERPELYQGTYR